MAIKLVMKKAAALTEAEDSKAAVDEKELDTAIDDVIDSAKSPETKEKVQAAAVFDETEKAVKMLDLAKEVAEDEREEAGGRFLNLCFISMPGTGKTAVIHKWARNRGVQIFEPDAHAMDELDFKGKQIDRSDPDDVKYSAVRNSEWDRLKEGNWVVFLDEYEKVPTKIRGLLLSLIADHTVPNPSAVDGRDHLDGMLFTVVAGNPAGAGNNIKQQFMDSEKTRWETVFMTPNRSKFFERFTREIERRIQNQPDPAKRARRALQLQIAEKLLKDDRFQFTSVEQAEANSESTDGLTTERSLESALLSCRDIPSFYDRFAGQCDPKQLPVVKAILGNFQVNDDVANAILNTYNTESGLTFDKD